MVICVFILMLNNILPILANWTTNKARDLTRTPILFIVVINRLSLLCLALQENKNKVFKQSPRIESRLKI